MTKKLYDKNFTILIIGQIISLFGSSIQRFALSLYLLDLTGSASAFATILAISMIPVVVISPIAGMLADRGDKKKLMVGLDFFSALLLLCYIGSLKMGHEQVIIIATVMVLLSVISTIYQPVVNTCIPILVDKDNLVRANALIQQVASLSNFLGPILAGLLYGIFGIYSVVLLNMLSFLFSALLELFLKINHQTSNEVLSFKEAFISDMRESYHYLRYKNPIVLRMLLYAGFYNLFLVPVFSVAMPYLIKVTFSFSSSVYGVCEGIIALGMIFGGLLIAAKPNWFHIKRVYRILYLTVLSMLGMGIAIHLYQNMRISAIIGVILLTGGGMLIMGVLGVANVLTASYLYASVEGSLLGKVLAFSSAFAILCIPVGQILFGYLIELFSHNIYYLVYLASVFVFGVTLLVRSNVLRIKD